MMALTGNGHLTARWLLAPVASLLLCGAPLLHAQRKPVAAADFSEIEALIQQHRFAEARSDVLEELKQHPSDVEAYNLLGIIETNQRDYAGAIASFQRALQISPRSTKTHNNLGSVYLAQQQPKLAENEFRTVLRLDPGTPKPTTISAFC